VLSWFCAAWVWISNVVCVLWTTIVTTFCIVWEVVVLILTIPAIIIELFLAIPIVGRLIGEIWNVINSIIHRIAGIPDAILTLIGITPLKKIRVCLIILRDENGAATATEASLQPAMQAAIDIFRDEANVAVIFDEVHTVDGNSPTYALDVNCNLAAWGEDLWLPGTFFQAMAARYCPTGAVGRLTGYANPIVVFAVRDIPGNTAGCALGPVTDYLTIEGGSPVCLAHEMGHKTGLWHCCPNTNLANGTCGGLELDWWQRVIVRDSKYVTYI